MSLSAVLLGCASLPPGAAAPATARALYVFDCGRGEIDDGSIYTGQPEDRGKPYAFSISCYLVVHDRGLLLWDTGAPDAIALLPGGRTVNGPFTITVKKPLLQQLQEVGYGPGEITYVAFSHMHPDHAGNANAFARSTVLMQAEEYDAAFGPTPERFRFNPALYGQLKDAKVLKLRGDHDVFGDGSVVVKRAPGHTPGSQALFVRLASYGPVVVSGDVVHSRENWEKRRVPSLNFDRAESLESMASLDAFLQRTGARLLIQHDLEQNQGIPHAPQALR